MKKWLMILMAAAFLAGCGSAAERSEFWKHSSMYKNWDHTFYSWTGYKKTTESDVQKTREQNWWGIPENVKPQ